MSAHVKAVLPYTMDVHSPYKVAALSRYPKGVSGGELAALGLRLSIMRELVN